MDLASLDWTCHVCRAGHPGPTWICRRCGAAVLLLARIRFEAGRLTQVGRGDEALALAGEDLRRTAKTLEPPLPGPLPIPSDSAPAPVTPP